MVSANCWVEFTVIATAAGEIVTLILVTGSVQVFVELEIEELAPEVVQTIAVDVAALWQEASPITEMTRAIGNTNNARRLTTLLASLFEISNCIDSVSILIPKI